MIESVVSVRIEHRNVVQIAYHTLLPIVPKGPPPSVPEQLDRLVEGSHRTYSLL